MLSSPVIRRSWRWSLALAAVLALVAALVASQFAAADSPAARSAQRPKPTVVLVHGAWADGSSWSAVVQRLQRRGYPVLVPPNPLRGLASDAAYLAAFVRQRTTGPVVLVGHSYGGAVMFPHAFANDLPRRTAAVLAVSQRPITFSAGREPSGVPAWKSIPSWYLVGTIDNVIPAAQQRFMAQRAGAKAVEVKAGHLSMLSRPGAVTDLIGSAARGAR